VALYVRDHGMAAEMNKDAKAALIRSLLEHFPMGEESRSLFEIVQYTAVSLVNVFQGKRKSLLIGEVIY
jgi:hypothetical protein